MFVTLPRPTRPLRGIQPILQHVEIEAAEIFRAVRLKPLNHGDEVVSGVRLCAVRDKFVALG
jgi:hypothetical protein